MKTFKLTIATILIFSVWSYSQCDTTTVDFDLLVEKYAKEFEKIEEEGGELAEEDPQITSTPVGVTYNIEFENQDFSLDLISVTMKNKKITFNAPQVTMKNKTMSFKKPEVTMVNKKIGQKPEITCRGLKCTTKWKNIYTKIPQTTMKEYKVITAVPEFKYASTSFITKIPEVKKHRTKATLKVPRITIGNVSDEAKEKEEKAKQIEEKAQRLADLQKEESITLVNEKFNCHRYELEAVTTSTKETYEASIAELTNSINSIKEIGADPGHVPSEDGSIMDLFKVRDELYASYTATMKTLEDIKAGFDKAEQESLGKVVN